jgi:hypothetical protein
VTVASPGSNRRPHTGAAPPQTGGIAILLGAEINAEAERRAAAQAGHPQAQAGAAQRLDQAA